MVNHEWDNEDEMCKEFASIFTKKPIVDVDNSGQIEIAIPADLLLEKCSADFEVDGEYNHNVKSVSIPKGTLVKIINVTPNDVEIEFVVDGKIITTVVLPFEDWEVE